MFIKGLGRETGGQVGVPGLVTAGPVLTLRPEEVRGVTGFPEGCAAGAPERRGDLWSKGAAPASYQGLCRGENTLPCLSSSLQTAADASAWADPAGSLGAGERRPRLWDPRSRAEGAVRGLWRDKQMEHILCH